MIIAGNSHPPNSTCTRQYSCVWTHACKYWLRW